MTTVVKRFGSGAVIIICRCDRVCNILLSEQNMYLPTIIRNNTCDLIHPKCTNRVGNPLNKTYSVSLGTKNGNKTALAKLARI
jgi:hypothetical protein